MSNIKETPKSYLRYTQFRDESGMNDCRVCREAGIPTSTMYSWKAGRYEPKLEKMVKISKVLNISLEQLVGA